MITFTLDIPDIEFLEFTKIDDFAPRSLPAADRSLSNIQNYIRYNNMLVMLAQFAGVINSKTVTLPTTLGASAPTSGSIVLEIDNLDPIINRYSTGDVSAVTLSSPDTTTYTEEQIQTAGYVLKEVIEFVLSNDYTEIRPVVDSVASGEATELTVQYKEVTASATSNTITITAS